MSARVRPVDVACAVGVVAIWTFFMVFARMGVKGSFTPWDLAFVRLSFSAAVVLPIYLMRPAGARLGTLTGRRGWIVAAFAGLCFTLLTYLAFSFAPAAHGAVLMPGTLPFSTTLVAWLLLGEKVTTRKAWGLGFILLGVAFIGWHSLSGGEPGAWRGDIIFPFASCCFAIYAVLSRRWQINPLDAVLATPLLALVLYLPVYLLFLPKQIMGIPWTDIVFQGVMQGVLALVVSMWLFTKVVQAFGPTRTTMITAVCPGLAALSAVPILGEPLLPLVVLGLLTVTVGMVIGVTGQGAPPAAPRTVA